MELAVLFCVFAITLTKVIAKPIDLITKDGNTEGADISGQFKFKLTQAIQPNFKIVVNGSLDPSEKTFTAVLPIIGEDGHCAMNYNHLMKTVDVLPRIEDNANASTQSFKISYDKGTDFSLEVTAVENGDDKMMEMTLIVPGSGQAGPLLCSIKNFEDLGYIHLNEGTKYISSILFTF